MFVSIFGTQSTLRCHRLYRISGPSKAIFVLIISSSHVQLFVHPDWIVRPLWISGILHHALHRDIYWPISIYWKWSTFSTVGTPRIQSNGLSLNCCHATTKTCLSYATPINDFFFPICVVVQRKDHVDVLISGVKFVNTICRFIRGNSTGEFKPWTGFQ